MSNKTKPTNNNEHVDGVTNSVQLGIKEKLEEKFWEIYRSSESNDKKIKKWNEWNESNNIAECTELTIDATELSSVGVFQITSKSDANKSEKWRFSSKVVLKGKFIRISLEGAEFNGGLEIKGICDSGGIVLSRFQTGTFSLKDAVIKKIFLVRNADFLGEVIFDHLELDKCDVDKASDNDFTDISRAKFEKEFLIKSLILNGCDFKICEKSQFCDRVYIRIHSVSGDRECCLKIQNSNFVGDFKATIHSRNPIGIVDLTGSAFKGRVLIDDIGSKASGKIGKVVMERTTFEDIFVLKVGKIFEIPDISKAYLLDTKKLSLSEESWEENGVIDEQKITDKDEPKFRFLKKYFAEQGNHFKEQEYFSYEMMAREKKLDDEGGSDWLLFKTYKHLSDFGMSAFLPFSWLCFVCSVFFIISLFFGCDAWSGLTNSVVRTLNPLAKFECSAQIASDSFVFAPEYFLEIFRIENRPLVISSGLRIVSALQSVINAALIFLFILAIRNKFKIK